MRYGASKDRDFVREDCGLCAEIYVVFGDAVCVRVVCAVIGDMS